jgi:lactate dehydrogenase-like 2-hydroxyacid dehydrogenase
MKIVKILENSPRIELEYLKYLEEDGFSVAGFDKEVDNSQVYAIVIRSKIVVDEKLLQKYENLSYVLRVGVGLDKVDLGLCKEKNITVYNTP